MGKDRSEKLARIWLESQRYTDIRDLSEERKDPPDFLVNNRIAVEVTRLTHLTDAEETTVSIEKRLEQTIGKILAEVEQIPGGYKVLVSCDLLDEDIPPKDVTERQVRQAVEEYIELLRNALQSEGNPVRFRQQLECNLSIRFSPLSTPRPGNFELLQVSIAKSRVVVRASVDSINRSIQAKSKAIEKRSHKYSEWWLALVEYEGFTPPRYHLDDWREIRNGLVDSGPWSKIVVINLYEDVTYPLMFIVLI